MGSELKCTFSTTIWDGSGHGGTGGSVRGSFDTGTRHKELSRLRRPTVQCSGPHVSVSQPRGSGKLSTTLSTLPTSPSSDRSTWSLSQKSQCPSGTQGKLDKWEASEGKVGQPVILYWAFFSPWLHATMKSGVPLHVTETWPRYVDVSALANWNICSRWSIQLLL